jgi:hypothetical protein
MRNPVVIVTDPYEFAARFDRLADSIKCFKDALAKQAPEVTGSDPSAGDLDPAGAMGGTELRQEPGHDR